MFESETFYLLIAGCGLAFLLVSLLLGEALDFAEDLDFDFESEPSWFNLKAIAAGAIGFGIFGYLSVRAGIPVLFTLALAIVGFFVLLIASLFLVLRPLFRQQSNSQLGRSSYIGLMGSITLAVQADGWGEVQFTNTNGSLVTERAIAHDGAGIPTGTSVVITDVGETNVTVVVVEF
ncbi:hypothetical protein KBD20_00505 [Candidatus Saccharibacteria bacterium]|nr:hypothetical protein [Candidatus Saccharibacteria bacterium]